MTGLTPTAHTIALALIGSERPKDRDLDALLDGVLPELAPKVWLDWRVLAATALIEAGYDSDAVHRALEITNRRAMPACKHIPKVTFKARAERALDFIMGREVYEPVCSD